MLLQQSASKLRALSQVVSKAQSSKGAKLSLLAAVAVSLASASTSNATLIFDNMDGTAASGAPSLTSTGSTPNTFMGDAYTVDPNTTDITGLDLFPVNLSGTNFTNLKLNIYIWGTVNTGTVAAGTPAFSNLLGSYALTSTGTFTSGFFYSFVSATPGVTPGITFGTPLVLPAGDNTLGLTLNYQGSTDGVTYNNVNSLTSIISTGAGAAPTVGSDVFNGYYRNAASETNGNFTSTLRSLGLTNQSLGLRLYGDVTAVPEPASLGILAIAAPLALARRRRQA